ncbi:MAG: hypothetical protein ACRDTV_21430 [Mycobacterium sp.]
MGILVGFAPWVVYWVLVGNAAFGTAALVALAIATAAVAIGLARRSPGRTLEIGAAATFLVLAVLTFTLSPSALGRWVLPLSNAGLFLAALTGGLIGKPLESGQSEPFRRLTWVWVAVIAAMTVSSSIPPLVSGEATIHSGHPLSLLCYWVVPFGLWALGAFAVGLLFERMATAVDDVARKTTFVAYDEATIDELYYLAQQHANREVGAGKEAFDVKVGGLGTPLVGDESRKSWPATYRVRERV